ncbi:hypothetical protein QCA50_011856 [Cerrena zonata]|uniref:F-box domain-containing protein n=1 Tax=Cerrena zonata TaxID=2478898 RepID=A0AAW0G5L7_9APHY
MSSTLPYLTTYPASDYNDDMAGILIGGSSLLRISNTSQGNQSKNPLFLPVEIHNYILETFWDSKNIECSSPDTIRACTLTCQVWYKAARPHIFRVIVLKRWEDLQRFSSLAINDESVLGWVQRVRLCGSLPPLDRSSAGQELPADWGVRDRWIYYFPYLLAPRIRDKTNHNDPTFNIKILELFDFSHISGAVEDCEWFAFWVLHLSWLKNVETLYLKSCEMASNAMTALAHSFPQLRNVGFTHVDLTSKNHAGINVALQPSLPFYLTEETITQQQMGGELALPDQKFVHRCCGPARENGVDYTIIHPAPRIESIYINNETSEYTWLDLNRLYGWMVPYNAAKYLKSMELSAVVELCSISKFITELGSSPCLQHLSLWIGCDIGLFDRYAFDFSKLTNLMSLRLHGSGFDHIQLEVFIRILSTLKAPELRRIMLAVTHNSNFTEVEQLDDCLAENFSSLEVVVVECVGLHGRGLEGPRQEIQAILPKTNRRGLLEVQTYSEPFRY